MLYDMKDKQYKDKTLRRKLWEEKASEYGVNCKFRNLSFCSINVETASH